MDVTPGTVRSQRASTWPSRPRKGRMNPPRQASTWQSTPRSAAMAASSGIGSMTPWG